jgi:crotonobetainyl-CoA:carnitine CoA-transferase CaiB-like acyl-CoA transferase
VNALEGMRVVDLSHVIAGPTCGYYLAHYGADVIKVEEPTHGDVLRAGTKGRVDEGVTVGFATVNAGKRSVTADLKDPEDLRAVLALAAGADVFIENFRPGVVERLGLGYEAVRAVNPSIVYVSISAYGQEGAWAPHGAYDHVVQAFTGMMSLQGEEHDPPIKVGFPVIDSAAGMSAAQAVLAALLRRARTGEGARLDLSMTQAAVQLMLSPAVQVAFDGRDRPRPGNRGFTGSPGAATFRCAKGWIATSANTPAQFTALCGVLGLQDLLGDDTLIDVAALSSGAGFVITRDDAAVRARVETAFAQADAAELEVRLNAVGVAAARVRTLHEFVSEYSQGGMATHTVTRVEYPQGALLDFGHGAKVDRTAPRAPARAPRLGAHDEAVLGKPGGG